MGSPEQRVVHSSEDPCWGTEQRLFEALNREARFKVDLAATVANAKVQFHSYELSHTTEVVYLGPDHPDARFRNALDVRWAEMFEKGPGFLNPPYSKKLLNATKDPAYDIYEWARKCFNESEAGFETWGIFPFSPQTEWYRYFIMGHGSNGQWRGHAAMEVRRIPHRVDFEPSPEYAAKLIQDLAEGKRKSGEVGSAGHNVVVVRWGPNPGYVGPWVPTERYWDYR